jgi:hypothetical protein
MEPDLRDPDLRVFECARCSEPVWATPAGGAVEVRCGYCGHEDRRELPPLTSQAAEAGSAYRGALSREVGRPRTVDLSISPKGYPARPTKELLREKLAAARARLAALEPDDAERPAVEYEALWAAATLASTFVMAKDPLRARAALESALADQHAPVYRALVLARLARLAAHGGAEDLAERWLAAIPPGLRVPEIAVDVRIARAMLARARGDAPAMLDALGPEDALFGASRPVAMALLVDAHERRGDIRAARAAYRRGSRGAAMRFAGALATFDLAPRTRARTARVGFLALGLVAFILTILPLLATNHVLAALAVIVVGALGAVVVRSL